MNKNKPKSMPAKTAEEFQIGWKHCFRGEGFTVDETEKALKAYSERKQTNEQWLYHANTPIFLDANVLLNIYMDAVPQRGSMLKFLEDNKDRIYITDQVQNEILRHRLEFIETYRNKLTPSASAFRENFKSFELKLADSLQKMSQILDKPELVDSLPQTTDLVCKLKDFHQAHEMFTEDFKSLQEQLGKIKDLFEEEYHTLYEKVNIEYNDHILEAISKLNILPPLTIKEKDFTKERYKQLRERFKQGNGDSLDYLRFPGSGDSAKDDDESKEPWGDLLIYHQILSFMAKSGSDAIFVTNDKSKRDWMRKDGSQYSYYVVDSFHNTGQILFIVPVTSFLPKGYSPELREIYDDDSIGDTTSVVSAKLFSSLSDYAGTEEYKDIDKDTFITELRRYSMWTKKFGNDYVSQSYFIIVVLGQQGYKFSSSFDMLDQLNGKDIEKYQKITEDGAVINCIRLIKKKKES